MHKKAITIFFISAFWLIANQASAGRLGQVEMIPVSKVDNDKILVRISVSFPSLRGCGNPLNALMLVEPDAVPIPLVKSTTLTSVSDSSFNLFKLGTSSRRYTHC